VVVVVVVVVVLVLLCNRQRHKVYFHYSFWFSCKYPFLIYLYTGCETYPVAVREECSLCVCPCVRAACLMC
jgi:cytochrome bd-type quinol oxidase subunit 2